MFKLTCQKFPKCSSVLKSYRLLSPNWFAFSSGVVPGTFESTSPVERRPEDDDQPSWHALHEFFDDKKLWGEPEIKTGRPWSLEELRLKSNSDLHKLWYVLLKERNRLLTLEHYCKFNYEIMPNPERIDKVDESMGNLETIVAERNKACLELEFGSDGRRPHRPAITFLGFADKLALTEHPVPPEEAADHAMELGWISEYEVPELDKDAEEFQIKWREKLHLQERDRVDDEKREKGEHKWVHRY